MATIEILPRGDEVDYISTLKNKFLLFLSKHKHITEKNARLEGMQQILAFILLLAICGGIWVFAVLSTSLWSKIRKCQLKMENKNKDNNFYSTSSRSDAIENIAFRHV